MAQNVTIAGAAYSNVPAVDLPKTGGGTARFYDTQGNKALSPSLSEQTGVDVKSYATASVAAITKELLAQLDGDFVAENIKKDVDLFGLVGTLEGSGGGGSSWTDNYSVFATGTFTPAESINEVSINTGVPYANDLSSRISNQTLIVFREPNGTVGVGWAVGLMGSPFSSKDSVYSCAMVCGGNGDLSYGRLKRTVCPSPSVGDTTWTITGLSSAANFRAGKPYRWMLLGVLK